MSFDFDLADEQATKDRINNPRLEEIENRLFDRFTQKKLRKEAR